MGARQGRRRISREWCKGSTEPAQQECAGSERASSAARCRDKTMSDQTMEVEIGDEVGKGKYWSAIRVLYRCSYNAAGGCYGGTVLVVTAVSRYRTIVNGDGVILGRQRLVTFLTLPPRLSSLSLPFPSLIPSLIPFLSSIPR